MIRGEFSYKVPRFQKGLWEVVVVFRTTTMGVTRSGPFTDTTANILPDSVGVYQLRQAIADVWGAPDISHPFSLFVMLNRRTSARNSSSVVTLGPFEYKPAGFQ